MTLIWMTENEYKDVQRVICHRIKNYGRVCRQELGEVCREFNTTGNPHDFWTELKSFRRYGRYDLDGSPLKNTGNWRDILMYVDDPKWGFQTPGNIIEDGLCKRGSKDGINKNMLNET